jgi:hypothetical protein
VLAEGVNIRVADPVRLVGELAGQGKRGLLRCVIRAPLGIEGGDFIFA